MSTQTANKDLTIPEMGDDVAATIAALGENFRKLDAPGVKLEFGSYTGNGTYGNANANSLTFTFEPRFVLIQRSISPGLGVTPNLLIGFRGASLLPYGYGSATNPPCSTTWTGCTVRWYSSDNEKTQLNSNNQTYFYLALG